MKLIVIGDGKHGKDTVCGLLRDMYGCAFVSSSFFAMERAVRPYLQNVYGIIYNNLDDCYNDRSNHRSKWHDAIAAYCADDPTRLGRELFFEFNVYCGCRSKIEFDAMKKEGLFDFAFWVDRSEHVGPEPISSNKLTWDMADFVIYNNSDLEDLRSNVKVVYTEALRRYNNKNK